MTAVYFIIALLVVAILFLLVIPKTRSLRITGMLPTSPDKIFPVLTDLSKTPQWIPQCTKAIKTDGRDGAARKQRVTYVSEGASHEQDQQVTTWVDNRQYGWKQLHPTGPFADARTVITLTKRENHTEIEILGEWTASSLFAKIPATFSEPKRLREHYEGMILKLQGLNA